MNILIDIGHPAHVHYFRNFIKKMQDKGHIFLISARNRPLIHYLLKYYNISFIERGKGQNSLIGKFIYMIYFDIILLIRAIKFKPNLFLSFASPYVAQVAWLLRKPHIVLDDTEHAKFGHLFYKPFSSVFLNPACFYKDFGDKQIHFQSYMEYFYLHPKYFQPNSTIYSILGIRPGEKYVILRFVSWKANHDIGQSGLDEKTKHDVIEILEDKFKVFVSSENNIKNQHLAKYNINIPPENMHQALYHAEFFVTESGTMASEAAILNTPVIYVNSLPLMGYLQVEKKAGILFHYINSNGVKEKVKELMNISNIKECFKPKNLEFLKNIINPTEFLVWFVENYPSSARIMRENPEYQYRFR